MRVTFVAAAFALLSSAAFSQASAAPPAASTGVVSTPPPGGPPEVGSPLCCLEQMRDWTRLRRTAARHGHFGPCPAARLRERPTAPPHASAFPVPSAQLLAARGSSGLRPSLGSAKVPQRKPRMGSAGFSKYEAGDLGIAALHE